MWNFSLANFHLCPLVLLTKLTLNNCTSTLLIPLMNYLEIQLNYITAISLTRERSVLQLRVIFVMVSVLFKTTGELVSHVKLVERLSPYRDYESSLKTHP